MTYHASSPEPTFMDRARIKRGLAAFAALTVLGLGLLFAFTNRGDAAEVVSNLSAGFLLLAAAATLADLVIGALRYQIFLRRIRPGTSLWLPMKADLANRFTGAVTPSQTGGGPAQVFILHRGGIPIPEALSFLMINLFGTLVFFLMVGSLTAWGLRDHFADGVAIYLVQWGFLAFGSGLTLMVVGLARPDLVVRFVTALVRRLEVGHGGWARMVTKVGRILMDSADRYEQSCREFIRKAPWLVVGSFMLTVVLYLNKFTLAWFVLRGLGANADYGTTLAVQALLHFVLYVAPTPGGAGIAELVTAVLMSILLPEALLGPFTLAYRFFLLYLPATAGALVLARAFRPGGRPDRAPLGAVATTLPVAALIIGLASTPRVVLAASPQLQVPVVDVQPLAEGSLARELEGKKALLREALTEGSSSGSEAAAEEAFTFAVELGRYLIAAAPEDAEAHYLLSVALGLRLETAGLREKINMGGETRREAEIALELDPNHAGAHHVMGRLHAGTMRMGRVARFVAQRLLGAEALAGVSWERAEYHFLRAQEIEPENPRHSMELGVLYIDTDRTALAFAALSRAMTAPAFAPSDSLAVARAGELLASLHCPEERCAS